MTIKKMLSRLTGLSTPVFGVSWNPPEFERDQARNVIAFLENRRVLYVPSEVELPQHCVDSVIEIRHFLTDVIGHAEEKSEFVGNLRSMRSACLKFMNAVQANDRDIIQFANHQGHYASWHFMDAIGQMRGVFGVHLAAICTMYDIDIDGDLASIMPDEVS